MNPKQSHLAQGARAILFLFLSATAATATTIILAGILKLLWSWFCVAQYGLGPTIVSWYGLSTIVVVAVYQATTPLEMDPNDPVTAGSIAAGTLFRWVSLGISLGFYYPAGLALGWLP